MNVKERAAMVGARFYLKKLIDHLDNQQPVTGVSWQTVDILHKQLTELIDSYKPTATAIVWHEGSQCWYKAELMEPLKVQMQQEEVTT